MNFRMYVWLFLATLALATSVGCGSALQDSCDVIYLTFGRPDYPYGSIVRMHYDPDYGFEQVARTELGNDAVLLYPPPHMPGGVSYVTIVGDDANKNTAYWNWPPDSTSGPDYLFSLPGRVALLTSNTRDAEAALVVFVASEYAQVTAREFGRKVISLQANARCSVAVVRNARPDSIRVLGECRYARPDWLGSARAAFITRSGILLALSVDAPAGDTTAVDTLAVDVEAFSHAQQSGDLAVAYAGDSVAVFDSTGVRRGLAIHDASVPALSPDGAFLAFHKGDQSFWIQELATGKASEIGVGYPVNWAQGAPLVLFFERRVDERRVTRTIFHVADARSGSVVTIPEDGFVVDAALWP